MKRQERVPKKTEEAGLNWVDDMIINTSSFGLLVIDGKSYHSDLIIFPDGRVKDRWRRKSGHRLEASDIKGLIKEDTDIIIAGTGVSGMVRPDQNLKKLLEDKKIRFIAAPNDEAIDCFNELSSKHRVGACFHLTC
jgi:hypothetical protein